jgi:hypothetical protein
MQPRAQTDFPFLQEQHYAWGKDNAKSGSPCLVKRHFHRGDKPIDNHPVQPRIRLALRCALLHTGPLRKKKKIESPPVGCFSYKLYRLFLSPQSLSVTTVTLGSRLFFNSAANKLTLLMASSLGKGEDLRFFPIMHPSARLPTSGVPGAAQTAQNTKSPALLNFQHRHVQSHNFSPHKSPEALAELIYRMQPLL